MVFMALGINQVTYSNRKFCRSVCLSVGRSRFCYSRHFQVSWDDELWQAYQGPGQIKLEMEAGFTAFWCVQFDCIVFKKFVFYSNIELHKNWNLRE